MSARAALGLGGNLGDPRASMAAALRRLDARTDTAVARVSRLFSTPPWGLTDQPRFLNACALVETDLAPLDLLDLCLSTETALKRERRERWGPRTIDIDLLDHGGSAMESERLVLPHPRIHERAFVLVPLADIAPDLCLRGRTVSAWLAETDTAGILAESADGSWWRGAGAPAG